MNCLRFTNKRLVTGGYGILHQRLLAVSPVLYQDAVAWPCRDVKYMPACHSCYCNQITRGLKTTCTLDAAKWKNSKKKLAPKPISVRQKKKNQGEVVTIWKNMTVRELAVSMDKDVDHIYEVLMYIKDTDKYDNDNAAFDDITVIQDICKKSGCRSVMGKRQEKPAEKENKDIFKRPDDDPSLLVKRPPVVTIMGHVDHGKTTLLDQLRMSNIVDQEFGGITQHIGAFSVTLPSGEKITFLDTPGHAAFSAMRARGAQATDIVVLVVAAEDGVMNQTKESIQHAQEADVPVIVAINKIDKHEADIAKTKRDLMSQGMTLEEDGGDIQVVPISALKGTNLLLLQEAIVTLAELMELKANPAGLVEGVVIESRTDPGRGKLATVLVQRGTLKRGANIIAGQAWGKVRGMFDEHGNPVQTAGPSIPVEVIGWRDLPSAGDEVLQVEKESRLKEALAWRKEQQKQEKMEKDAVVIQKKIDTHQEQYQEQLKNRLASGRKRYKRGQKQKEYTDTKVGPELSVIIKGDVDGSVEAILDTLDTFESDKCRLNIIHYGVGPVTENDVDMAATFDGEILAFNLKTADDVKKFAASRRVPLKTHNVIYRLFEDLVKSLNSLLPSVDVEEILGQAKVLEVFQVTDDKSKKKVPVAGCRCTKGSLNKRQLYKVYRGEEVVYEGLLSSLKHFKNEVDSIKTDMECGLRVEDKAFQFQRGDEILCYKLVETKQTIDWQPGF